MAWRLASIVSRARKIRSHIGPLAASRPSLISEQQVLQLVGHLVDLFEAHHPRRALEGVGGAQDVGHESLP